MMPLPNESHAVRTVDRLLDKWAIEERTSLDITTIYRKMKAGTFPQPVRVGKRRVAWRESDVTEWLRNLEVGTRILSATTAEALDAPQDAARMRSTLGGHRDHIAPSEARGKRFTRRRP